MIGSKFNQNSSSFFNISRLYLLSKKAVISCTVFSHIPEIEFKKSGSVMCFVRFSNGLKS
ncbi:MAG: hypothetical protein WCG25_06710 [bacterium]